MQNLNSSSPQTDYYIINDIPGYKFPNGKKYVVVYPKDKVAREAYAEQIRKEMDTYYETLKRVSELQKKMNK